MKLFAHLYGYILLGMIVLIGLDEYLNVRTEIEQYESDMIVNAIEDGNAISAMIAHIWKESGEAKALELIRAAGNSGSRKLRWVWLQSMSDGLGGTIAGQMQLQQLYLGNPVSVKTNQAGDSLHRVTYVPVDVGAAQPGALELSQPLVSFHQFSKKMVVRAITITSLLGLVCGCILYYFIDRKVRLPLLSLMAQVKRIGQGNLRANDNIVGNDELAELARNMNEMCSRLLIAREKIKFESNARLKTLEQLRHTARLSSFGVLSAEIAHELGTPLNVVDGRAKMIITENLELEEIHDCATIIKNQVERMTVIIRQLLDFTRRPKRQISSENVVFLIKQVFQLLHPMACKHRVFLSLDQDTDTEVMLNADFSHLQQVLVNLIMNAIQAMPDGGKVEINLSNKFVLTSSHEEKIQQKYLLIQIQDEGEGICEENLENIFTPFFTTKTLGAGTGLGLSIAHGIVEEHGGWIDIESTVQQGTCFSVYLPMRG